jgi:hypothetical protein
MLSGKVSMKEMKSYIVMRLVQLRENYFVSSKCRLRRGFIMPFHNSLLASVLDEVSRNIPSMSPAPCRENRNVPASQLRSLMSSSKDCHQKTGCCVALRLLVLYHVLS